MRMDEMDERQTPECDRSLYGNFYYNFLGNLLEGCQIISPDWRYLYINDAAIRHSRLTREQLIGHSMLEVYPGIENTPMFSNLRKCMADRKPRWMENRFIFPDGSAGWFEVRFEPVPEGIFILTLEITDRKQAEEEKRLVYEVLELINGADNWEDLLKSFVNYLQQWSGCEAVGIRVKDGVDFPYYVTRGFSDQFVRLENSLCAYGKDGELICGDGGDPLLECMCGNIICGRFDPSKSFFTTDGSFWSNCTTDLLATTTDAERQARTRNRCNAVGYESVALIPLRSGKETFGLIQLNDKRKGRFTREQISLYRSIVDRIAIFFAKKQDEARIIHLNNVLRGIRNVNQLIYREKNRDRLIRKICDFLVEARGFRSVVVGLTGNADGKVQAYAGKGREFESIENVLAGGDVPDCVRQAMLQHGTEVRRYHDSACKQCPGFAKVNSHQDTVVVSLDYSGRSYGFMMTWMVSGMSDSIEEHDLLREVADDIAFALHAMKIKRERDRSEAALADTREQLRQVQKLEAIGRLAGGVAHDFNNLLMVQMGYCDLMRDNLTDDDPFVEDLAQIRDCADRAATLTRQLLAFSRKQTLQPEVLDLNAVVGGIENMLKRLIGENIEFVVLLTNGLGRVMVDPGQMEQVIMNLAINARDAMPRGGKLIIETANVEIDGAYTKNHLDAVAGPHVMLAITDTGCGMDEEIRSKLFEPFFTTKGKGKGTGLGLATVYGIIKQSGGNIWVYSEPGKGTTFKIYLPRVASEPAQPIAPKAPATSGKGELILLVEDEAGLRKVFSKMITKLGYQVRLAADGEAALRAFKEEGLRPALLITDVVMPGMSGRELVDNLIPIWPDIKVLYISGYTDNAIVHHGVLDSKTPFLEKPFTSTQLAEKISNVLLSVS